MILLMLTFFLPTFSREISQFCVCGHVDNKEQCQSSGICIWNGYSCGIKSGNVYIQQISDESQNQCSRYAQEDCILLDQCGFYLGECVPFIDCSVFQKNECSASSFKCASDGNQCIERKECQDYQTEIGCQYKNIHEKYCYWDISRSPKCSEADICDQLPLYLTDDSQCRGAIQNCTISGVGFGCSNGMEFCNQYQFENQCVSTYDQSKLCFWDQNQSNCYQKTCENRKLSTDDECKEYLNACTSNGSHCILRKQCSDVNNAAGCVTDINGSKCVFTNQTCQIKTCSTAPNSYNNYQLCQLYDPNLDCVSAKNGGCKNRPNSCEDYQSEIECYSIYLQDCTWYSGSCAKRQCFHAPIYYSHEECKTYGECMGKNGGGCQLRPTECGLISQELFCDLDLFGNHCVWEDSQCKKLICSNLKLPKYDSHQKCIEASKYCTFNIEIGGCVDYICPNVIDINACTIDSNGNQCNLNDGCIVKRCKLAPSYYKSNQECESWQSTCTVNVYQFSNFILLFGCITKVNDCVIAFEEQCQETIYGEQCKWNATDKLCGFKQCIDADTSLYVFGSVQFECQQFKVKGSTCILHSSNVGCTDWPSLCTGMLSELQCSLGLENGTKCAWDATNIVCHSKQCSDASPVTYVDNIKCNSWISTCIFNPTLSGCQYRASVSNCSASPYGDMYDTHEKCQAWDPNCTVIFNSGCTNKENNCSNYKSENQCIVTLGGIYCYWDYTSNSCQISQVDVDGDGQIDCNLRVMGDLTHKDCEDFMPICTINDSLSSTCVALESNCSSYTLEQQCRINASQSPCFWDRLNSICIDLPCSNNTTAITESDCFNYKRSLECQLKYGANGIKGKGCEQRHLSCSEVTQEVICNKTITVNQDKCFYFNNQCSVITDYDCHYLITSKTNEECIYYNKSCMLQYSGIGCQSIKYCNQLTDLNCNSSVLSQNIKCIFYATNCTPKNACSDLFPSESSCSGKKTSLNEQCQYTFSNSNALTICNSQLCSNKSGLTESMLSNQYICQEFSSICSYDASTHLTTKSCVEIQFCSDLTSYSIIDYKLCNNSMTKTYIKCGFNFITNQCQNRQCQHLLSSYVGVLTHQLCYDWNYDCVLSGGDCIAFNNNCSEIKLVYQCLQYPQCRWHINSCINQINCHSNATAVTNYHCELIGPVCKLDFINQYGCAFQNCAEILDSTQCIISHTSDGLDCDWISSCLPKQCNQYATQVICEAKYGVLSLTPSIISSKCYWCSAACSNNYDCNPTFISPPVKHSDCNSGDVTTTISYNKIPKCIKKSVNCSDYTYPQACQTTISGHQCFWSGGCVDICKTHSSGPYTHSACFSFKSSCMASTGNTQCQLLNCTSITTSPSCNQYLNKCIWQTTCIAVQGCIIYLQINCNGRFNENLIPCYWDTINTKCTEKTCSNFPTIPTVSSDCTNWLQNCLFNSVTSSCYEDCNLINLTTHSACESHYLSKSCTIKPANRQCIDLPTTCSLAVESQCFKDGSGNQCYYDNTLGQCVLLSSCSVLGAENDSHDKCQALDLLCTVNSTLNGCIILDDCSSYLIEDQCILNNFSQSCQWVNSESKCVLKSCQTAQLARFTAGSCQQYFGISCTVETSFATCNISSQKCSDYNYYQCISDGQKNIYGTLCFWKSDKSQCAEQICENGPTLATSNKECSGFMQQCQKGGCRLKICTDYIFAVDKDCAAIFEDQRCATNGYQCVERNLCQDAFIQDGCTFDIQLNECLWISSPIDQCITKTCETAPLSLKTNNECYEYLSQCTAKKGGGCIKKSECSANLIKEACFSDIYGQGCIWDETLQQCFSDQCEGFCGDGIITNQFEICDDGNYLPYDGCYKCQVQCPLGCLDCEGINCNKCDSQGWQKKGSICQTICGDGIIVGKEYCDDGNEIEYDGCYNCQYSCDIFCSKCYQGDCIECPYGFYENGSYCLNKCGDGIFAIQFEECEDGNTFSKDGCNQNCEIEKNWKCYTVDSLSVCEYNISPSFKLQEVPTSYGQNQEVQLSFSEEVRLNSQSITEDIFIQQISAQIINMKETDYTIEIMSTQSISSDLSSVEYKIRVSFTSSVVGPTLVVAINCDNLVNQYDNQLIITTQEIQLKDPLLLSQTQKNVAANAALFNQLVIYSLISIGAVSFLTGNLEILWNLVDLLQQLSYIKYINIQFPQNVAIYFEIFGLVTIQPLVDKINLNNKVESLFSFNTPYIPATGKFEEFQINCYFGLNFQSFILVLGLGVINYFISYILQFILTSFHYNNWPVTIDTQQRFILKQIAKIMYFIQKLCRTYYTYFFYSGLIRIYLSNYYDITFSAFLQVANFNTDNKLNLGNSFLAAGILGFNCIAVFYFYSLLISSTKIANRFNILIEDIAITKNKWNRQHQAIVLIKKTMFIINLILLQRFPVIQPIIISVISGFFSLYVYNAQPCINKFENYKLIITEVMIAANTILFSASELLTLYSKQEMISTIGWINIAGFTTILVSALIIDFYQQVGQYMRVLNKFFHQLKCFRANNRVSKIVEFF